MDVPSPRSDATLMKSKAMAAEGAMGRNILVVVNARKKDAAVPTAQKDSSGTAGTSHTAPANTKERADRAMGFLPGPTTTPRGVKSIPTVRAPRGAGMNMAVVTPTASARGAMEAANTNAPVVMVVVGTAIALAETNMELRRMRATDAGLGVMGAARRARRLLAPRG